MHTVGRMRDFIPGFHIGVKPVPSGTSAESVEIWTWRYTVGKLRGISPLHGPASRAAPRCIACRRANSDKRAYDRLPVPSVCVSDAQRLVWHIFSAR